MDLTSYKRFSAFNEQRFYNELQALFRFQLKPKPRFVSILGAIILGTYILGTPWNPPYNLGKGESCPMSQCKIPGCNERSKGMGLCQHHYDQFNGKIRRERDKIKKRECPFLGFKNPYRKKSGFNIIFELIRTSRPLTKEQIFRLGKAELGKAGMRNYRIDYAWEILKAERHACKRSGYQLKRDEKGLWQLMKDTPEKAVNENI